MHYRVSHVCAEMAHVSRREFVFAELDHGGRKIHFVDAMYSTATF